MWPDFIVPIHEAIKQRETWSIFLISLEPSCAKFLLENELTQKDPTKSNRRRPWVRYEREHSLSAVHMDWYTAVDGYTQVCVVIDDASRMVLAGGEFYSQTAENSISLLKEAYEKYQHISPIREVITDYGTQFYGVKRDYNGEADHSFENFCKEYGIKQIYARVKHPQTNGKVERFVPICIPFFMRRYSTTIAVP